VSYRGVVFTPSEATILAASLRDQAETVSQGTHLVPALAPDQERQPSAPAPAPAPTIWYEDSELKRRHKELVRAGMERARKLGKHIGRPHVSQREGFAEHFTEVVERIGPEGLSNRQAVKELGVSLSTLRRLRDAAMQPSLANKTPRPTLLPSPDGRYTSE
jgi:hypothetical protein